MMKLMSDGDRMSNHAGFYCSKGEGPINEWKSGRSLIPFLPRSK